MFLPVWVYCLGLLVVMGLVALPVVVIFWWHCQELAEARRVWEDEFKRHHEMAMAALRDNKERHAEAISVLRTWLEKMETRSAA